MVLDEKNIDSFEAAEGVICKQQCLFQYANIGGGKLANLED